MIELIVVALCILLNAILAAVEMAFVTIGKPELRLRARKGDTRAEHLLKLRENPERALSVIQIGITFVGAVSAAVGGAGAQESLAPYFQSQWFLSEDLAEILAITLVVIPLTYASVVLGELVPKTIALRYPAKVLRIGTYILIIGARSLRPAVAVLEASTHFITSLIFSKKDDAIAAESNSDVDLQSLSSTHRQYVMNLVSLEGRRVRDVMLPWNEVDFCPWESTLENVLDQIINSGHTRLPVVSYDDSNFDIKGVIHAKELMSFAAAGNQDWRSILRAALVSQPQDELLNTLRRMQEQRKHMSIVVQNAKPVGIVTLEDILEEVIGDVFDEDDDGLVDRILAQRASQRLPQRR
ncbi:MAG TPA: hemolysin family protein [Pseudobdellovibrionaceae bacterium]|nr:hemolysin family protein [Pseudobdellovibrionaceae bacterium]